MSNEHNSPDDSTTSQDETLPAGDLPDTRDRRFASQVARIFAQPPLTIAGYQISHELSRGGQGVVYQAVQIATKRKVAIKVLVDGTLASPASRRRFEREIELVAQLKHQNIIAIFDSGQTEGGLPFAVMDYIRGEPLNQFVRQRKPPLRDVLTLFGKVCSAVQHAHNKGVIHRDLKPSNILVDADGEPKILDFGLAKQMVQTANSQLTLSEQVVGTLPFLSPEQARGNPDEIDTRTDIYALGVILYELLTGQYPYPVAGAMADVLRHIEHTEPTPPSQVWQRDPGLTRASSATQRRELAWIPLKALRKDRAQRYRSAAEMGDDLRNFLEGRALIAGPESAGYRLRKFVRRYRGAVGAVAAVILALGLGLLATMFQYRRAERKSIEAQDAENRARQNATTLFDTLQQATRSEHLAQLARSTAEIEQYSSAVSAAALELELGNSEALKARLDACPEYVRDWEWFWLKAESDRSIVILDDPDGALRRADFSPDGTLVLTVPSSLDRYGKRGARVWDAQAGLLRYSIDPAAGVVDALFCLGGQRIAVIAGDSAITLWEAATGRLVSTLRPAYGFPLLSKMSRLHTTNDGTTLLSQDALSVHIWDLPNRLNVTLSGIGVTWEIQLASGGTRFLTHDMGGLTTLWSTANGNAICNFEGDAGPLDYGILSGTGKYVISTCTADRRLRVWDAEDCTELASVKAEVDGLVALSPDDRYFCTAASDGSLRVYATRGAELCAVRPSDPGRVWDAVFSPCGTKIATARDRTVAMDDVSGNASNHIQFLGHQARVNKVQFSRDGTWIVTASDDGTARLWFADDDSRGAFPIRPDLGVSSFFRLVQVSRDRQYIAANCFGSSTITLLCKKVDSGRVDLPSCYWFQSPERVTFSPSCDKAAVLFSWGEGACILAIPLGEIICELDKWTACAAFHPQGRFIATGSYRGFVQMWDLASGERIRTFFGHSESIQDVAYCMGGERLVTVSADCTARVWDCQSGEELAILVVPEPQDRVIISSDGNRAILVAINEGTLTHWDLASGAVLATVKLATEVTTVEFNNLNSRLVVGSVEQPVRMLDASTLRELISLPGLSDTVSAQFTSDGTQVIAIDRRGNTKTWDAVPRRVRYAQKRARESNADDSVILKEWMQESGWAASNANRQ